METPLTERTSTGSSLNRAKRGGWCNHDKLPRGENGRALCRQCNVEVPRGRFTFCSAGCVHEWKLRTSPQYLRQMTWERDGGVCAKCQTDTMAGKRHRQGQPWAGHWRATGHLWQADHIVPVIEGGGECGLENIRTLCTACHRSATARFESAIIDDTPGSYYTCLACIDLMIACPDPLMRKEGEK